MDAQTEAGLDPVGEHTGPQRLLRRGEFSSRDDLLAKITAWIAEYDRTAKPFAWTTRPNPLKVA